MPGAPARVSVIENNILFAESLVIALTLEGYTVERITLEDRTPGTLLAAVLRTSPRVALLDLDLGHHGDGSRLVEPLTRAGVAVLVVTGITELGRWGEALAHGARRVMPKSSPLNEIAATIRRIHLGFPVTAGDERSELIRAWHTDRLALHEAQAKLARLTPRESEVLAHFMEGHQVKEIAHLRAVSEATVRTQAKAVLAKLEVSSQLAAVGVAHQARWVPPSATGS